MKIQLDWLKDYVQFKSSPEELAHLLTMGGLEVEALEEVELPNGGSTWVMELNVTPNRGYCLSYLGVAREVAAFLNLPISQPFPEPELENSWGSTPIEKAIAVDNLDTGLCPRYSALVIENVRPGPSPQWLVDKLHAIGLRPINNIVDITNFVMMEFGQPLHAFDRELLSGPRIVIRRARSGEPFVALDGSELKLDGDALVIADAERPVALAGIMGGANSQVSETTRNVVLESACFESTVVRKASKKYGIRSDSSYRFERGVDIDVVITAQARAALLIRELAGGDICKGRIDRYPSPFPVNSVSLRVERTNQVLGSRLKASQIREFIERLGMRVEEETAGESFRVEIPRFRPTLCREIDLIEEVARLDGYDRIETSHPHASVSPVRFTRRQETVRRAKMILCDLGYSEAVSYSFIDAEKAAEFLMAFAENGSETVALSNPLSGEMGTMRTSLLPGLLDTAVRNLSKGQKPVKVFETGHLFYRDSNSGKMVEKAVLAGLAVGVYENNVWKQTGKEYDFYDVKGVLESVFSLFKLPREYRSANKPFLDPAHSVECLTSGRYAGFLGKLSSGLVRKLEINQNVFLFEIDLDTLIAVWPQSPRFQPIPKYPETYRDISILVDKSVPSRSVEELIYEVSAPLINRVELYDHFDGKKIEKGKKSLTFALSFQSPEKTLTDQEVNPVFDRIVKTLSGKLGASLRE